MPGEIIWRCPLCKEIFETRYQYDGHVASCRKTSAHVGAPPKEDEEIVEPAEIITPQKTTHKFFLTMPRAEIYKKIVECDQHILRISMERKQLLTVLAARSGEAEGG